MKRYDDCIQDFSHCQNCSLSSYGKDCRNAPVNILAYLRKLRGYTQLELSELSGVSINTIKKIEYDTCKISNVTLSNAISLSDTLSVDPHILLTCSDYYTDKPYKTFNEEEKIMETIKTLILNNHTCNLTPYKGQELIKAKAETGRYIELENGVYLENMGDGRLYDEQENSWASVETLMFDENGDIEQSIDILGYLMV